MATTDDVEMLVERGIRREGDETKIDGIEASCVEEEENHFLCFADIWAEGDKERVGVDVTCDGEECLWRTER